MVTKLVKLEKDGLPGVSLKKGKKRDLIGKDYSKSKVVPPAKFISDNDYSGNFKIFLDDKEDNQPFFFWVGGLEPHRRYEYEAGIKFGGKKLNKLKKFQNTGLIQIM